MGKKKMGSLKKSLASKQELNDSGYAQEEPSYVGQAHLLDLCDDVLLDIFKYLDAHDLKALAYTCPRLGNLVLDRTLWQRVDASAKPCGKLRARWIIRALGADTRELRLHGMVEVTKGCLGYINRKRSESECQCKGDVARAENGGVANSTKRVCKKVHTDDKGQTKKDDSRMVTRSQAKSGTTGNEPQPGPSGNSGNNADNGNNANNVNNANNDNNGNNANVNNDYEVDEHGVVRFNRERLNAIAAAGGCAIVNIYNNGYDPIRDGPILEGINPRNVNANAGNVAIVNADDAIGNGNDVIVDEDGAIINNGANRDRAANAGNANGVQDGAEAQRPARRLLRLYTRSLPRYGSPHPTWPGDLEAGGGGSSAGPSPCCPGPQFTLTRASLALLNRQCHKLTALYLEFADIDCTATSLSLFPPTLKRLSLRGTKCYNLDKSFMFKLQDHLKELEYLDLSECDWMCPSSLLPLSKAGRLTELRLRSCVKLTEFVAYASLATRYGFRHLKVLDLRGSPVGDCEVSALGWLPALEELHLAASAAAPRRAAHAHYLEDTLPPSTDLEEWEEQEPEYLKLRLSDVDEAEEAPPRIPLTSAIEETACNSNHDRGCLILGPYNPERMPSVLAMPPAQAIQMHLPDEHHRLIPHIMMPPPEMPQELPRDMPNEDAAQVVRIRIPEDMPMPPHGLHVNAPDVNVRIRHFRGSPPRLVREHGIRDLMNGDLRNNIGNRNVPLNVNPGFCAQALDPRNYVANENANAANNAQDPQEGTSKRKFDEDQPGPSKRKKDGKSDPDDASDEGGASVKRPEPADDSEDEETKSNNAMIDSMHALDAPRKAMLKKMIADRRKELGGIPLRCENNSNWNPLNQLLARYGGRGPCTQDRAVRFRCNEPRRDPNNVVCVNIGNPLPPPHPARGGAQPGRGGGRQVEPVDLRMRGSQDRVMFLPPASLPPRLDPRFLVSDSAIRRFGRADGDVNIVHLGPNGPIPVPVNDPTARPDRSSLRILTLSGYLYVTNSSLEHLITAAPHLRYMNLSGTGVTAAGVREFQSLRPDCEVKFDQAPKEE